MKRQAAPRKRPHAEVTDAEAATLAEALLFDFNHEADSAARLLLLLRAVAYEADATARENVAIRVEVLFAPYINGVDAAIDETLRRQLEAVRKGGEAAF